MMKKLCQYAVYDMSSGVCLIRGQKIKDLDKVVYLGSFWRGFRRIRQYCTFRAISGYYLCIVYWVGSVSRRAGIFSEPTDAGYYLRFRGTVKNDTKEFLKQVRKNYNELFDGVNYA